MECDGVEEVRDRCGEGRGPDDLARLLVIEVVIVRAVREDDLRPDGVEESDDLLQHDLVVDHAKVAFLEAVVRPADGLGSGPSLAAANPGDLIRIVFGRTAIAGGHGRDVDRPAVFLV